MPEKSIVAEAEALPKPNASKYLINVTVEGKAALTGFAVNAAAPSVVIPVEALILIPTVAAALRVNPEAPVTKVAVEGAAPRAEA